MTHSPSVSAKAVPSKYSVRKLLRSEGELVAVYLADTHGRPDPVEVHLLRVPGSSDEDLANRFLEVAGQASKVDHPAVLKVLDVGVTGGRVYFVTPHRQARSMEDFLNDHGGALPPGQALTLLVALAEGLEAIHSAGVIHRSISDGTVFVDAEGLPFFGECASMRDLTVCADPGQARTLMTSRMSPEQMLGMPDTARTDVFHFGALAYRMLSGKDPLALGDRGRVASATAGGIEPLTEAAQTSEWPGGLVNAVHHALEWSSKKRPESAGALATALRRVADSGGPEAAESEPAKKQVAAPPPGRKAGAGTGAWVKSSGQLVRSSGADAPSPAPRSAPIGGAHLVLVVMILATVGGMSWMRSGGSSGAGTIPEVTLVSETETRLKEIAGVAAEAADQPTHAGNALARTGVLRDWARAKGKDAPFSFGEVMQVRFKAQRGDVQAFAEIDGMLEVYRSQAAP